MRGWGGLCGWGGLYSPSAFDPECLEESSTASCDELLLDVPHAAVRARTRPRVSLAELSGAGWLSTASTNAESRWPLARLPVLICGDGGI